MSELVRLGDQTSKIGSGQTPLGGGRSYAQSGIPLIRSQNILMGSFTSHGLVYVSESVDDEMSGSRVLPGDVLLNITGASIGRVCVVPDDICPANVNQHVCIIRCKDSLDPEFVAAVLASPRYQSLIWKSQAGGTRQALTKQMIEDFEIPWLPTHAQQAIVTRVKSQLAEVSTAQQAIKAQLNDISKLADAIVVDSIERSSATNHSLRDVLLEIKHGVGGTWKKYPVLGATRSGLAAAKDKPGKMAEKYKPAFPGTLFYNPMRILIGSIAFVDEDDEAGITSPDYVVLQGKEGVVDSRWFYFWFRSSFGAQCINALARGAVRERILFNRLAEGKIDLPAFADQKRASLALRELKSSQLEIRQQLKDVKLLPAKILTRVFES